MKNALEKYASPILIFFIFIGAWEGAVRLFEIEQFLLPKPSVIVGNLVRVVEIDPEMPITAETDIEDMLNTPDLYTVIPAEGADPALEEMGILAPLGGNSYLVRGRNLTPILAAGWFTFRGAVGGLLIGCTAGILVAFITAQWTASREALMPFAIAANSMPIIAFAPIMNNWFGIDNPFSKMAIVSIMVFFPMMINTTRGLTLVDARSLELMRSYAAKPSDILLKLRVPNALPYIFNGFKVAAALSMIGAIVGEYFGGPRISLGVFITQEAALFRFGSAWAAIIMACVLGIFLYIVVITAERLIMPWHVSFR